MIFESITDGYQKRKPNKKRENNNYTPISKHIYYNPRVYILDATTLKVVQQDGYFSPQK
jgi:hypothetical protein